jgi:hypothetical protein
MQANRKAGDAMLDASTIISLITLGAVIIGAVVNVSSLVGKRELKAASDARMEVKLDNIYSKVDNIEKKQTTFEGALNSHNDRLIKVEESTKKIDSIEKKQDSIEATLTVHGERIKAVEESTKSAHHRLNKIENIKEEK